MMRVQLSDIEKAIRANFILSKEQGKKLLETDWYYEWHTYSAARLVFVGVALARGFRQWEICNHLDMTCTEYNGKWSKFKELFDAGREKYETLKRMKIKGHFDQQGAFDLSLRIYRKTILVNNYLSNYLHTQLQDLIAS